MCLPAFRIACLCPRVEVAGMNCRANFRRGLQRATPSGGRASQSLATALRPCSPDGYPYLLTTEASHPPQSQNK